MFCEKYKATIPITCCIKRQKEVKTNNAKFSKCKSCYMGLKVRVNSLNYLDNDIWHLKCQYPMKFKKLKLKIKEMLDD